MNPQQERVAGIPCYPSPGHLPGPADLAVLAVSAGAMLDAIRECRAAGIRHGIAFAGGFGEAGSDGAALQGALVELCRETGFTLCGPNCVGVINAAMPMTGTFATALQEVDRLRPGTISMVSQSGGIATSTLALAHQAGFGFRHLVSSGNEAVLTFADYVHALARDEGTRVIAGYLEGVADGPTLLAALGEARAQRKPVVLMKGGTTGASARAARAHTGALAGEDRVYDAIFRETAVIRVYSVEELVDVSLLLAGLPAGRLPAGPGVGIVTFGGGNGVLAVDQCIQQGLTTPPLSPASVEQLAAAPGPGGVRRQPDGPDADHGHAVGMDGAAPGGAGRRDRRARDPEPALHRRLARLAGRRDLGGDHRAVDAGAQARRRELAGRAEGRAGAAGQ